MAVPLGELVNSGAADGRMAQRNGSAGSFAEGIGEEGRALPGDTGDADSVEHVDELFALGKEVAFRGAVRIDIKERKSTHNLSIEI